MYKCFFFSLCIFGIGLENTICLHSTPMPPPPSIILNWGDSIEETGAAMHQLYPLVKKKVHTQSHKHISHNV